MFAIGLCTALIIYRIAVHKPQMKKFHNEIEDGFGRNPNEYCTDEYIQAMQDAYGNKSAI